MNGSTRSASTIVLCLSGQIGAGKSTLAHHLVSHHAFCVLSFADDLIAPAIEAAGEEVNRRNLQKYGALIFEQRGEEWMVKQLSDRIGPGGRFVIDDVRYVATAEHFKCEYGACVVFVETEMGTRANRVRERGRDDVEDERDLAAMDQQATEIQISSLRALADDVISNEDGIGELEAQMDGLLWKRYGLRST